MAIVCMAVLFYLWASPAKQPPAARQPDDPYSKQRAWERMKELTAAAEKSNKDKL
jgi:hypothetical protein